MEISRDFHAIDAVIHCCGPQGVWPSEAAVDQVPHASCVPGGQALRVWAYESHIGPRVYEALSRGGG